METVTFALGVIVGFLVFASLYGYEYILYRKKTIRTPIQRVQGVARTIAPKQKGYVIMPESDEDEAKKELIARNEAEGKETKLEDL